MAGRERTRDERLFAAAVLKRSLVARAGAERAAFEFVYRGVLDEFGIGDADVDAYLAQHADEVEAAIRRGVPR